MSERSIKRWDRCLSTCLALIVLFPINPAAESRQSVRGGRQGGQATGGDAQRRDLYSIRVADAEEAALVEQQLKIKPELLRGRTFYYYGDKALNNRLQELGYRPMKENRDEVFTRIVRVTRRGRERSLSELGALILLREPRYWVVRVNYHQLRALRRLGYRVQEQGIEEARPRLIRVTIANQADVREILAPLIDIDHVEQTKDGYVVQGGAFDNAIDELRAKGFKVEIIAPRR